MLIVKSTLQPRRFPASVKQDYDLSNILENNKHELNVISLNYT